VEGELLRLEREELELQRAGKEKDPILESRMATLRERQKDLEQRIPVHGERSIELPARRRELKILQVIADDMQLKLKTMEVEAGAPNEIVQVQPAVIVNEDSPTEQRRRRNTRK